MTEIANSWFDSYADEADITTTPDGTAFDSVDKNGTTTLKADTAVSIDYGSFTARTRTARAVTDASASIFRMRHNFNPATHSVVAMLFPFYMTALPGSRTSLLMLWDSGGGTVANMYLEPDGTLLLRDSVDSTIDTSSTALEALTVYWLGYKVKGDASNQGYSEAKIWDDSGTLLETVGDTTEDEDTGNPIERILWGGYGGGPGTVEAASWTCHYGELWVDDTDYPAMPSFAETGDSTSLLLLGVG